MTFRIAKIVLFGSCIFLFTLLSVDLRADILRLRNGDRITGTLRQLRDGTVTFNTKHAGTIDLPRNVVHTIKTNSVVTVLFSGNFYATGRLITDGVSKPNHMTLRSSEAPIETVEPFTFSSIKEIYREDPRQRLREETSVKLSGQINTGLEFLQGNTDEESYRFDGELQARTPQNRYTISAEFNEQKTDGVETEKNAEGLIKYDHFLSKRWFLFNSANFKTDEFEDLDLRTTLSIGGGYQFYEQEDVTLYLESGLSYIDENFELSPDESNLGLRYSGDYEQDISWVKLFHFQEGVGGPDIEFVFNSRTGMKLPLTKGFQLTAQFHFDWDADPPPAVSSTDTKYLLNLGYEF